jgi:hypothetical protein
MKISDWADLFEFALSRSSAAKASPNIIADCDIYYLTKIFCLAIVNLDHSRLRK